MTVVVIFASSQLLYATGSHEQYDDALFEAAMATITGQGLTPTDPFPRILEVLLTVYSVAVIATLAGSFGAFFLHKEQPEAISATSPEASIPGAEFPRSEHSPAKHTGTAP